MATQGGFGLVCKIKISSTLTAIAKIIECDFPETEKMVEDVTAHDTPNGWAEYIASGMRKVAAFDVTLLWDKTLATHGAIQTAFDSNSPVDMTISDPLVTETLTFKAIVTKLGRMSKKQEAFKCKVSIQPTGAVTIA